MKKVGVVGLGNMGKGMAMSLKKGGFDVVGYDAFPDACAALTRQGLVCAKSLAAVAGTADVIIMSLPTSAVVEQVVLGEGGLLENARRGLIIVDATTADPNSTRKIAKLLEEVGVSFVDAPVSGGPKGAATATLGMVLGGEKTVIDSIEPILAAISSKRVHVGPVGAGHVAKLLNNLLTGTHLIIAGEAARIATAAGLNPELIFNGLNAGSGGSKVTQNNFPNWIFNNAFDSGFSMKLMRKDLHLAMGLIEQTAPSVPLAKEVGRLWAKSADSIADPEDFNRIVQFIEK